MPANLPSPGVGKIPPGELYLPAAVNGFENARFGKSGIITLYFGDQKVFLTILGNQGGPFAVLQFFRIDRVHIQNVSKHI